VEELEQVETSLRRGLHDTEHGLLLKEKRIQELEASLEEERQLQHSSASRYVLAQAQSLRLIPQSSEVDGAQLSLSMLRLTQFLRRRLDRSTALSSRPRFFLHFSILHNLLFTFHSFFLSKFMKIFSLFLFHLFIFIVSPPFGGVCAIFLRLYASTERLKKSLHKPRANFVNILFQINYSLNYYLQLLFLQFLYRTHLNF
jgi:hypothetical protein